VFEEDAMHTRRRAGEVVIALGGALLLATLGTAAGNLLWEDVYDSAGGNDSPVDVARAGRVVIAVGASADAEGVAAWYARATDARDGSLLWDDRLELTGGSARAAEVAIDGARAFVAGACADAGGEQFLVVRAHHRDTGALLWEDRTAVGARPIQAPRVAAQGRRVFVSGSRAEGSGARDMVVRAYDAATGDLVWQESYDRGGDDFTGDLAVQGGRVFVGGSAAVAPFPVHTDFAVRALDAETGAVLWEDFYDYDGHLDQARELAVRHGRVYATGFGRHPGADDDVVVRADDAESGAALWTQAFDGAGGSDFAPNVVAIAAGVFVAGWTGDPAGNTDFLVRAHDPETGALLWQDVMDGPGDFDFATELAGRGRRLYVVGQTGSAGALDGIVRAYDARTGRLAWQERFGFAGRDDAAQGVAAGPALYVSGSVRPASEDSRWTVRAYELRDGHDDGGGE
jgi:outer membrane protein assembly factor BamB